MRWVLVFASFAFGGLVSGCGGAGGRDDTSAPGTVAVQWTVGASSDPAQCAAQGASAIEIDVFDVTGALVGTFAEACATGRDVISLAAGRYSATAELKGVTGEARTTTVDIDPFTIVPDTSYSIPVDFPLGSFL